MLAAVRSSRYALVTALSVALLSGAVSAGVAVYVSTNQSDRTARLSAETTLRSDRQKAYSDYLGNLYDVVPSIGELKGALTTHPHDRELAGQAVLKLIDTVVASYKAGNVVAVAGSRPTLVLITEWRTTSGFH